MHLINKLHLIKNIQIIIKNGRNLIKMIYRLNQFQNLEN